MIIRITGLRVHAFHGVLPVEKETGQTFVVDVVLDCDVAPRDDRLAETVDYGTLAHDLAAVVADGPYDLIETVAQRVADRCLHDERVRRAEVTVHKPEVPLDVEVGEVSVTLVRER